MVCGYAESDNGPHMLALHCLLAVRCNSRAYEKRGKVCDCHQSRHRLCRAHYTEMSIVIVAFLLASVHTACKSSTIASWPGFMPIGGTLITSSRLTRSGDKADSALEMPIFEWRTRCSIRSAPTNSSLGSMRIGTNRLIPYNSTNVEQMPQQVRHNADKHCMPSKYQPPPRKNPLRPLVVSNGTGLSANSPTAITPLPSQSGKMT